MKYHATEDGHYVVVFDTQHGPRSLRLPTRDLSEARALVAKAGISDALGSATAANLRAKAFTLLTTGKDYSVSVAVAEWLEDMKDCGRYSPITLQLMESHVLLWARTMRKMSSHPASITSKMVTAFINRQDGLSLNTKAMRLSALRSFFEWCAGKAIIPANPIYHFKKPDHRVLTMDQKTTKPRRPFSDAEVEVLLQCITGRRRAFAERRDRITSTTKAARKRRAFFDRTAQMYEFWEYAILLSRYSGLRLGDICNLEWKSILSVRNHIVVRTRKRDKLVAVPWRYFSERAIAAIKELQQRPQTDPIYVFPRQQQDYQTKRRMRMHAPFTRCLEACGMGGKHSFHDFRASFTVACMKSNNLRMREIAKLLGHSSITTTAGYAPGTAVPLYPDGVYPVDIQALDHDRENHSSTMQGPQQSDVSRQEGSADCKECAEES